MTRYEIEYNFILDKYLKDIKMVSPMVRLEGRSANKCDVLIDGKLYDYYRYDMGESVFIPKDIDFSGDSFDNVYSMHTYSNSAISFFVTRKNDGLIESYCYNLAIKDLLHKDSIEEVSLKYTGMKDDENLLNKKFNELKIPYELFFMRKEIHNMNLLKDWESITVRKNKKNIVESCLYASIDEELLDIINNEVVFEEIDADENESYMNISNSILNDVKRNKNIK